MKRKIIPTVIVAAFLAASVFVGLAQETTDEFYFWRLGHMDGPHDLSMALGISRDGKVAVGTTDVVNYMHAWRCDIDWAISTDDGVPPLYNELQVQEDIGAVAPSRPSAAYAASDKTVDDCPYDKETNFDWCGSLPVGTLTLGTVSYGVEWFPPETSDTGDVPTYVGIADFGGGISDMQANDVSADGTILVGTGNNKRGQIGFRADFTDPFLEEIPLVQLSITDSFTAQALRSSAAEAVSEDGLIIAGYGTTKKGTRAFVTTAEDWSADEPVLVSTILPMLGGGKFAEAYAMTPDGAIIAGRSDSPKGPQACIWFEDDTETWVVKGLGGLSKKTLNSVATSIAYRPGSVVGELIVVGTSQSILYPEEAFVWTGNPTLEEEDIGYFYDLEYILTKTGAGELSSMGSEWILNEATGISADGDRIVGWGTNPEGGFEAWLVTGFPYDELVFTHE